jgi:ATP-grasp domain, R2K clade family 3
MIVLSEATEQIELSASANENRLMTEAAHIVGCKVYYIPRDFERCGTAENALWHVPQYSKETTGIWVGYIPEFVRYEAIYYAALAKGIKLINTPLQHKTALEFDMFYPLLTGLTPESIVINTISECYNVAELLGFPVFVKGAVLSLKMQGWESCVANNSAELIKLTELFLKYQERSRGKVIVRKLVKLRHQRLAPNGFPMGREFRCFIYHQQVLKYGYYWHGQDNLSKLSSTEEKQVLSLAVLASARLGVPYVAVDVGQLENGEWIVIETADAQFAGIVQISALELWHKLQEI